MSEQVTIARPYAEAAFSLAREQNALPQWAEMLKIASNVASDPTVRAALDNPRLDNAAKESLLLSLCGDALSAEGKSFVRVLLESDRIAALPDIRRLFDTSRTAPTAWRGHTSSVRSQSTRRNWTRSRRRWKNALARKSKQR